MSDVLGMRPEWEGLPVVHNSDRSQFLRCRRLWNWNSFLRQGLISSGETPRALWFGSAFHFALEDFHGYKKFASPALALQAYAKSFPEVEKPGEWRELVAMGEKMLDYYASVWLPRRGEFETYWVDGVPQCEIDFVIKIPGVNALYGGTFDRIVIDGYGRLYVLDWKTAAKFDSVKWENDPQVSAYTLAASQLYGRPFEGVVMVQFRKATPAPPKILKNGKISLDKSQPTNYKLYSEAVQAQFGYVPDEYKEMLNMLAAQDGDDGDNFIRWDRIRRNEAFQASEENKLTAVMKDMLNPKLPIYPNPTRDCSWDCAFRTPCIALDDGSDWEAILASTFQTRLANSDWRRRIVWPDDPAYSVPEPVPVRPDDDMSNEEFLELLLS